MRKIIAIVCGLAFFFATTFLTGVFVFSMELQETTDLIAKFEIEITVDENENAPPNVAELLHIGDMFRVTVVMEEFPALSNAELALSFNPNVVEVVDATGARIDSVQGIADASGFFYRGQAFKPNYWHGNPYLAIAPGFPFLNQGNGTLGVHLRSRNDIQGNLLAGRQTVFWVYFRAIAAGDTGILLNGAETRIAHSFDITNPPNFFRIDFNYTLPSIHVTPLRIRTLDGENIRRIRQLETRREVYARLYDDTIPVGSKLILAVYDNGRFYDFRVSFFGQTATIELPNDINLQTAMIKAFLWCNSNDMEPKFVPLALRW